MSNLNHRFTYGLRRMGIAAAASALVFLPGVLLAEDAKLPPRLVGDKPVTAATLLDRIQIEDLLTKYYYDLSAGKAHELSEYFTKDAYLDVDSTIARGHAEIAKLYQRPEGATPPAAATAQRRRGHMLLTNPVINIDGDKATAEVIWTGVMNEGVGKAPSLYEEGREYSELRKTDGKWLISKRCISSDSGLPDKYDATYKPRERC
ncbi:MAG: nuclear transport factor 2 family protein [Gammaproteobacteria bacterium]